MSFYSNFPDRGEEYRTQCNQLQQLQEYLQPCKRQYPGAISRDIVRNAQYKIAKFVQENTHICIKHVSPLDNNILNRLFNNHNIVDYSSSGSVKRPGAYYTIFLQLHSQ